MKNLLFATSTLLLTPFIAGAQPQPQPEEKAPSLALPRKQRNVTPALEGFAGARTRLQMQVRWVQIDSAILAQNLPAWDKAGNSSHVATPDELKRLDLLSQTRLATVSERQLSALNSQPVDFSFAPFQSFTLSMPEPGPIDDMSVMSKKSEFEGATRPYMPNLAQPESRLPEMAPMPGAGGKNDSPFASQNPALRPQIGPGIEELMRYKFQLRPTIVGQQIALALKNDNAADNLSMAAQVKIGETAVFSIPTAMMITQELTNSRVNFKVRRTLLLVTPRVLPQTPRDEGKSPR